jgi:hypothetical protein
MKMPTFPTRREGSAFAQENRAIGESLNNVLENERKFRREASSVTMQKMAQYKNALREIQAALDIAYGDDQLEKVLPTVISNILEEANID